MKGLSSSRNQCTEQSPKESDDARCCINTICPPKDEHNSSRNMYVEECNKYIKIKNFCIKLVKNTIISLRSLRHIVIEYWGRERPKLLLLRDNPLRKY